MPRRRRSDGTKTREAASLTSSLPMLIRPPVFCSRPATMRNVVVLPQPDGPSSVTNSPSLTRRSTSLTAAKSPNCRLTFSRRTLDIRHPIHHSAPTHFLITRSCTHLKTITMTIMIRPITLTCSALPLAQSFSSTTDRTSEPTE